VTARVPVAVADVGRGVWLTIIGTDPDGNPVDVTGVVMAGPDETATEELAVMVRDAATGRDRIVVTGPDADAFLIARPVGSRVPTPPPTPGASTVHLLRRRTRRDGQRRDDDRWFPEMHEHVTGDHLAGWEGHPDVRLTAVHRPHEPIPDGLLP
jgi:hypothetical protein